MLKYTVDSKKGVQSVQLKKTNKRLFWRHLATKVPTLSKIPVAQTMPHKIISPVETGTLKSLHEANAHLCVDLKSKNQDSFATNPNWSISFQEAAFPLHPF